MSLYSDAKNIIELFEARAKKSPKKVALIYHDQKITYEALSHLSDRLAFELIKMGVKPKDMVAICSDFSLHAVIGIFAILKANATYLPLNPHHPSNRLKSLLADAKVTALLINPDLKKDFSFSPCPIVTISIESDVYDFSIKPNITSALESMNKNDLAYIIYTSGSTGMPKGVCVKHASLINHVKSYSDFFQFTENDVVMGIVPLTFDASVDVIFPALIIGGSVVLYDQEKIKDIREIWKIIVDNNVTIVGFPPVLLALLNSENISIKDSKLRLILTGSDTLKYDYINRLLGQVVIANGYGITEAVVSSTWHMINATDRENIPIGKPLSGTLIYVLDDHLKPVAQGETGEIFIGGNALASGYFGDTQKTNEKFIPDPFLTESGQSVYKTGDLGRIRSDGLLEFLGRKDRQISLRGLRIEPGEIETIIKTYEGIKSVIVISKGEGDQQKLIAYYLSEYVVSADQLRIFLQNKLPEYMVPPFFIHLDALPLTDSGKIDIKALPDISCHTQTNREYIAPRTKNERKLAEIWKDLFQLKEISIYDNLFHLGGHSLTVIRLISRINRLFDISCPVRAVFKYSDIASLSDYITKFKSQMKTTNRLKQMKRPKQWLLSPMQKQLWFLDKYSEGKNCAYNVAFAIRLEGHLNVAVLEKSLNVIIARHETLRTVFREIEGCPYQEIKNYKISLTLKKTSETELKQALTHFSEQPFLLLKGPLFRVELYQLNKTTHVLAIAFHHIIGDGWSTGILIGELNQFYNAYINDHLPRISALNIQYADYVLWQQKHLQGETLQNSLEFWKDYLKNFEPLSIPTDYTRPAVKNYRGSYHRFEVDKKLLVGIKGYIKTHEVTLSMFLCAVFSVILNRYSHQEDIVIGIPVANRDQKEIENIFGLFVNIIPLRMDLSANPTFFDLLKRIKESAIKIYSHSNVPLVNIIEALGIVRENNKNPIFDTVLALQNAHNMFELNLSGIKSQKQDISFGFSKFDLTLEFTEDEESLIGAIEYDTTLYSQWRIRQIGGHFVELISQILLDDFEKSVLKKKKIGEFNILSQQEIKFLEEHDNRTEVTFSAQAGLHELFEWQVDKNPDAIAVEDENGSLTYQQLNQKANQLACMLQKNGVSRETLVAVCLNRHINTVVSLLAVMKAGGAYVPLDSYYPKERLQYLLSDTHAPVLITETSVLSKFNDYSGCILHMDNSEIFENESKENLNLKMDSHQWLYIIYTSGSTGKPKGVMVSHKNVVNLLQDMQKRIGIDNTDCCLSVTTITFDISGLEIFLPLITGSKVYIASHETTVNAEKLQQIILDTQCTWMQATPSSWRMLINAGWQPPAYLKILTGGEPLTADIASALTENNHVVWNLYGPTETTIWSTAEKINKNSTQITIGQPIANTQVYILDSNLQKVPLGVVGEICIAGEGVAKGYFNQPELTDKRFVNYVLSNKKTVKIYRTGDQGRYLPDGNIECLGRIDHQIKLRGHRIELGELENHLCQHPQIKQAVVVPYHINEHDTRLIAHIIPHTSSSLKRMHFSLFYFSEYQSEAIDPYYLLRESVKFADENAFHAVWTPERHFHAAGGQFSNPSVISAGLATMTKRLGIRAGSVVLPLHNPIRVVEEWSIVDNLSDGRVGIAFAPGWNANDFAFFPERYNQRREIMFNMLEQVKSLWKGDSITMNNGLGTSIEIKTYPRPKQPELPIWLTVRHKSSYYEAGKIGAHILTHLLGQSIDTVAEGIILYRKTLAEFGYDPKKFTVTVMLHTFVWNNSQEALEITKKPFSDYLKAHISLETMASSALSSSDNSLYDDESYIVDAAFKRYTETASLIGSVEDCFKMVVRLNEMGVDEIACLIDFGISQDLVIKGLHYLNELRARSECINRLDVNDIVLFLKKYLPDHMAPSGFVQHNDFPLTLNGKIDRLRLVNMSQTAIKASKKIKKPETETECRLANIWQTILATEIKSVHDDFFELGGHSLLAMLTVSKIRAEFGVNLQLKSLFTCRTLQQLACEIDAFEKKQEMEQVS